jgi:hypothetical protein
MNVSYLLIAMALTRIGMQVDRIDPDSLTVSFVAKVYSQLGEVAPVVKLVNTSIENRVTLDGKVCMIASHFIHLIREC